MAGLKAGMRSCASLHPRHKYFHVQKNTRIFRGGYFIWRFGSVAVQLPRAVGLLSASES